MRLRCNSRPRTPYLHSEIVWENLELTARREAIVEVFGLVGVAWLLFASVLMLVKLRDLAAVLKKDESDGMSMHLTAATNATDSDASGHKTVGFLFELYDLIIGAPFDWAAHKIIALLQDVGLSVEHIKTSLSLFCAVVVVIINLINKLFIKLICYSEGADTLTQIERALFSRLSVVLVLNTVVVPLAVEVENTWRVSEGAAIVDQSWFEAGGIISTGILVVVINAITKVALQLLPPAPVIKRTLSLFPRFASSYGKVFKLWKPPDLLVGEMYAALVTTLTLCLLYAPFYPPIYLVSAVGLALNYWSFKVGVVVWYKKPPSFNEEMAETLRKVVSRVVLPLHVGSLYLSLSNASFDPPLAPVYATGVLVIGYILLDTLVLHHLPAFHDYDQLSGHGDTTVKKSDGTLVTVNYDQVTKELQ